MTVHYVPTEECPSLPALPRYAPTAAHPAAYFIAVDSQGEEISLRYPTDEEVLCSECIEIVVARHAATNSGADPDSDDHWTPTVKVPLELQRAIAAIGGELHLSELTAPGSSADGEADPNDAGEDDDERDYDEVGADQDDAGEDDADEDGSVFPGPRYRASGQLGHDCSDDYAGPVWMIRSHRCSDGPAEHVRGTASCLQQDYSCRTGQTDLGDALEHLDDAERQQAVDAHLRVISVQARHLHAAEQLLIDTSDTSSTPDLTGACPDCLTDTEYHLDALADDISARALALAPVLAKYATTLTLGPKTCLAPASVGSVR